MSSGAQANSTVDRITLEVICEGLIATVREMREAIIRASYSSVIYEFDDFSCGLFGPGGEMVAQSWDHPGHVLPLPWGVRCALEDFKDNLHPGDAILLNDPYRGGTHLNDVTLLYPVFDEAGNLLLFPAVRAHWVDVGGMVPGSYSGLSTNIYQEGVRIPPIKIMERGVISHSAITLLMANMRAPEEREGDLHASLGACRLAEKRIRRFIEKYGWETVRESIRINLDRTERRMRDRIAALPDGTYCHEDYLEFFNEGRLDPVLARLQLTVQGDQLIADFTGSNPQVPGVVNNSLAVAGGGVLVAVKATLDPGGSINDGVFRPITLKAPEGSIFNVRLDAPAGAHGEVRKRAVSLTMAVLAQMIPDKVCGDLCGSSFPNAIGGWNSKRNRHFVYYESPAGGNGGFHGGDGPSTLLSIDVGHQPAVHNAESLEAEMPVLVEGCALRTDSGGEGRWRGGAGMIRKIRVLTDDSVYSVLSDRAVIPPWGVLGAGSGYPYHCSVEAGASRVNLATPGKATGYPVRRDEVVVMSAAGGGGYGDPLERDPEQVSHDVRAGYVSKARAREGYGVVLSDDGIPDLPATEHQRRELKSRRFYLSVVADDEVEAYVGDKGKRRVLALARSDIEGLGGCLDGLAEMLGRHPAPLRAWLSEGAVTPGQVRLDAFARRALGVDAGDRIELRLLDTPALPKGLAYPRLRPVA